MHLHLPCSLKHCSRVNMSTRRFPVSDLDSRTSQISPCDHMQRVISLERYLFEATQIGPALDLLLFPTLLPSLTPLVYYYSSSSPPFQSSLPAHVQSEALCRDQASKRADGNAHAALLALQHDSPYVRTIHAVSNIADSLAYCHPTSLLLSIYHSLPADSQGLAAVFIHLPGMYKYSTYNTCKGSFLGLAHHARCSFQGPIRSNRGSII
jgi:hypothetical protein